MKKVVKQRVDEYIKRVCLNEMIRSVEMMMDLINLVGITVLLLMALVDGIYECYAQGAYHVCWAVFLMCVLKWHNED